MPRRTTKPGTMIDSIGRAVAKADGANFEDDRGRFRRLAMAALVPLVNRTDAMIDAAHDEAVWSDAFCAINSRADFKKAVKAMIAFVMKKHDERGALAPTPRARRT